MKKLVLLLIISTSFYSFSQEMVKTLNLKLAKDTDVFQVVDDDKKQILLFFNDKYKVRTLRFDEHFELIDSLSAKRPNNDIVGYSSSKNNYYTYWLSPNNREMESQCFNFDTKQVSSKTFSFDFLKEKPIKQITVKNVFYLITILKNTSILNFYVFKEGQMEKKSIDLTDKKFINRESQKTNLWEIVNEKTVLQPALEIQNMLNETPASLIFSASKRKAYINGNNLIFTFDCNNVFTQLLTVNLTDFSATQKSYSQPYIEETESVPVEANSFLLNDKIIQIKLNSDVMHLSVKDLEGNEIKMYDIYANQEIGIKNSEIIQENGKIGNTRILDNSNQLLRKIYNLNPSISCYQFNDKIYLTMGSVSTLPDKNNNAMLYSAMFGYGLLGALIGIAITSNYSVNNLNSYRDRKVVYINCLFDSNFNHINGTVKKLAFDQLRVFADQKEKLVSQTVFRFNSNLFFGGYDKENNSYSFYNFND